MSKPALDDLFSITGRRNRKSYIEFKITSAVMIGICLVLLGVFEPDLGPPRFHRTSSRALLTLMTTWVLFALLLTETLTTAQRLRDLEVSGWWVVAVLLCWILNPISGFLVTVPLLVLPGSRGENKFGKDPLEEFRRP